ncbi:nucleotidyl transferase AbiEii/AbiGii toxin family protein [Thiomicrorhabdus sp. zzn3]|uniref:nucleotidyl transferase AbiEii/AbiGii toxin family protein n=1 Tax=Thiomicrorhabdus sp. zzn3 TaxID=3039775 RepID=UPI002436AD4A|nr:nucleotidyl transferase AbiEii/AbiGii toxin family protein [Thiomicrorhabdus sp. zzn3]MDG6778272.1 nucleotidyl transferase AbiEii/AbiGii toxin family protein [Thiomicrorhabdus sp. zzn3]
MDPNNPYFKQVALLVRILPVLEGHPVFALKGGTAINLFVRDLPRLSVDIDLAYEPVKNRDESMADINKNLSQIAKKLDSQGLRVQKNDPNNTTRLTVSNGEVQIKIETSPVLRGTVHPAQNRPVSPRVEDTFGYAEVQTLSFEDLYAGKICAALDRQHPRDLYDVKALLENEGISEKLKDTFLVYLMSHGRPMHELLNPNFKDITDIYANEFENMTRERVELAELLEARTQLVQQIRQALTDADKAFLLSVKKRSADWSQFVYPEVANLPAIKWKVHNLAQMPEDAHNKAAEKLEQFLQNI